MSQFCTRKLSGNAKKVASTPEMNEKTILPGMLEKHMSPKGKCGQLAVTNGTIELIWEDTGLVLTADPAHPVLIDPERYHRLRLTGPVSFHVDFYSDGKEASKSDPKARRPGETFCCSRSQCSMRQNP